ncbi:MAG: hypothetical protein ACRC6T_09460 [Sarcina sp.]
MYNVILTIYTESMVRGCIKTKEKIYYNGPFYTFEKAQTYMDVESLKKSKIFNQNSYSEPEYSGNHDRVSIVNENMSYYKCYDYRIEEVII